MKEDKMVKAILIFGILGLTLTLSNLKAQCWQVAHANECFGDCSPESLTVLPPGTEFKFTGGDLLIFAEKDVDYVVINQNGLCPDSPECLKLWYEYTGLCCTDTTLVTIESCNEESRTYNYNDLNSIGCDSLIIYTIINRPSHNTTDTIHFCNSAPELQSEHYINQYGCDSIVTIHSIVNYDTTVMLEPIFGDYPDTLETIDISSTGCDSTTIQYTKVKPQVNTDSPFSEIENEYDVIESGETFPNELIYVPTAFSPNGDGNNDLMWIETQQPLIFDTWQIFDRWGNKVFAANKFSNHQVFWDGKYKNEIQAGVYSYFLNYKGSTIKGSFQIVL